MTLVLKSCEESAASGRGLMVPRIECHGLIGFERWRATTDARVGNKITGDPSTTANAHFKDFGAAGHADQSRGGLEKKRRKQRAHFPPAVGSGEVTRGPLGEKTAIEGQRLPDQEQGIWRCETDDLVARVRRNDLPIHDCPVTEAGSAPRAGTRLARTALAVFTGRVRATATARRTAHRRSCPRCCRRL
jgi:hypothetical protein